jgi:hypothetical protein
MLLFSVGKGAMNPPWLVLIHHVFPIPTARYISLLRWQLGSELPTATDSAESFKGFTGWGMGGFF